MNDTDTSETKEAKIKSHSQFEGFKYLLPMVDVVDTESQDEQIRLVRAIGLFRDTNVLDRHEALPLFKDAKTSFMMFLLGFDFYGFVYDVNEVLKEPHFDRLRDWWDELNMLERDMVLVVKPEDAKDGELHLFALANYIYYIKDSNI